MDSEHGSESSHHSRTDSEFTGNTVDTVAPLISFSDSDQEFGIIIHPTADPENTTSVNEVELAPAKKLKSSFSSESSLEEFQVDPKVISKSSASVTALLLRDDKIGVSSDASPKSEGHHSGSTVTSSAISDLTHESTLHSMSPTQSPTIQVMERPGGYNPSRIPASVFASKSPGPNDQWSVASTESLFSIQIGNNSFSRDLMLGGDLYKSGEMTKSGELIRLRSSPPAAVGRESNHKIVEVEENLGGTEVAADETMKHVPRETEGNQSEENLSQLEGSRNSSSTHRRLDLNGTSRQSFAFSEVSFSIYEQLEKKKSARTSCHCCNCGWGCCCRRWPSCHCCNWSCVFCCHRWPSCHCCNCSWAFCCRKWPSCHCCNCSWAFCCCKWPRCKCSNCSWASLIAVVNGQGASVLIVAARSVAIGIVEKKDHVVVFLALAQMREEVFQRRENQSSSFHGHKPLK
uniref:Uncharacterized protein n=1 Tax=Davidia involucrata TaxID=16924 RepID=A0A5B7CA42_DAVIN